MSQQSDTSLSHRESTIYLPAIRSDSSSSSSSSSAPLEARPALKAQLIEHTFVDQKKLIQKLRTRYGKDAEGNYNFRVQLRLNRFTLFVPEIFPDHEINECCWG